MNGKRLLAALFAAALVSAAGVLVFAESASGAGPNAGARETQSTQTRQEEEDARKRAQILEEATVPPETLESVSFARLEGLIRENNLNVRMMDEQIALLHELDYEDMEQQYRDSLNGMVMMQDLYRMQSNTYAVQSLQSSYESLYQSFRDLISGKTQKNNADVVFQLQNTQDQIVMGGEALYIVLLSLDTQKGALERQLAALNRTVEEMELRYQLGQISALTLQQTKAGRSSLRSGLETLKMNIRTSFMQLENLLGAAPSGELHLGALPAVTEREITAMDVEADFAAARDRSYELYAAAKTLEEAQETFEDAAKAARYREESDAYKAALHTWTAAQDTYNAAIRNYELRFRTLYEQVKDFYQVWEASLTALEFQQSSYAAQELRHRQGNLSENALLSARDELEAAEETVVSNANSLFSAYNNYCWAVQRGILNA